MSWCVSGFPIKLAGMSLSYEQSGVNYDTLDAFKRACQRAAAATTPALALRGRGVGGGAEGVGGRGAGASLREPPDGYVAQGEGGVGTKTLAADAMFERRGGLFYHAGGGDPVATME